MLEEAYLFAERGGGGGEMLKSEQTPDLVAMLVDQIADFRVQVLPRLSLILDHETLAALMLHT